MAAKKVKKEGSKSVKKWPQKVPKVAENGGERGQPTKKKVGCKKVRNGAAKQEERWLQKFGKTGQPTRRKVAAKFEEKRAEKSEENRQKVREEKVRKMRKREARKKKQER